MENSGLITKALQYIRSETHKRDITVDDVANYAGFSTDYFNRIFSAHTGFNVMEYVRFTRLKKAALLLRTTDQEILDIALTCGYEAHESFTRAFKKQYGKTPIEYRRFFAEKSLTYADTVDKTAANRFLHEFPAFHSINADDVTDFLLENDAKKHGISAITMYDYNGTRFFSDTETSCVGIDEFQKGVYYADVLSDSIEEIVRVYETIKGFVSEFSFYSDLPEEEIHAAFRRVDADYTAINRMSTQYIYTGDRKELPGNTLRIKPLSINDLPTITRWASQYGNDWKLKETLTQRDLYHNDPHDLPFGIFDGDDMVGAYRTAIYERRGFRLGEMEGLCVLKTYKKRSLCDGIHAAVLNELILRDSLPFVSSSRSDDTLPDPAALGFELVKTIFCICK